MKTLHFGIIQKGAVGAEVHHHHIAVVILDHEMVLRQQPVGIGQHKIVRLPATHGQAAALHTDRAGVSGHCARRLELQCYAHFRVAQPPVITVTSPLSAMPPV